MCLVQGRLPVMSGFACSPWTYTTGRIWVATLAKFPPVGVLEYTCCLIDHFPESASRETPSRG